MDPVFFKNLKNKTYNDKNWQLSPMSFNPDSYLYSLAPPRAPDEPQHKNSGKKYVESDYFLARV